MAVDCLLFIFYGMFYYSWRIIVWYKLCLDWMQDSHAHRLRNLPKSKLLVDNVAMGHHLNMCEKVAQRCKSVVSRYLKLKWKKFGCLASEVGGSGNIFWELFGDQKAEDTFWLDSSTTDQVKRFVLFLPITYVLLYMCAMYVCICTYSKSLMFDILKNAISTFIDHFLFVNSDHLSYL